MKSKLPSHEELTAFGDKYQSIHNKVKDGDTVEISGFYFDWIVKNGYSKLLKKEGLFMSAQGGLLHSDEFDKIIRVNGNNV